MRVLGIDPGFGTVGYGVVDRVSAGKFKYVASGAIKTKPGLQFGARLSEIADDLRAVIKKYQPEHAAVEQLFFASNTTTAMKVAEARGVINLVLYEAGLMTSEFTPLQIKMALTGDGSASKAQVKKMVQILLGVDGLKGPDDMIDALAVGMCV